MSPCLEPSTTDATTLRTARVESSAVIDGIPRFSSFAASSGSAGRWTHPATMSRPEHACVELQDFVEEAVQVFRFEPSRLELLANGESTDGIWDRFEWTRDADGAWSEPRRLMPY